MPRVDRAEGLNLISASTSSDNLNKVNSLLTRAILLRTDRLLRTLPVLLLASLNFFLLPDPQPVI